MAWSRLQSVGQYNTGVTTLQVGIAANGSQWAANLSAGTKLIAWVMVTSLLGPAITSVTDAAGNSFVLLGSGTYPSGNNMILACYVLDTPPGDVGTQPAITLTTTNTATFGAMALLVSEVSGLPAGTTAAVADGTIAFTAGALTATTNAFPAYTSHTAGEFLQEVYADTGSNTVPTTTGFTVDTNVPANGNAELYVGFKNSTNAAETGSWANILNSGGSHYLGAAIAFKPPPVTTSGSGAVTFAGSGTATVTVNTTGTAAMVFAGAGTAAVQYNTSGTGAMVFAGTGTVSGTPGAATGTGAVTFAGTGTASIVIVATGTGAVTFAGTGFVAAGVTGGTGAVTFAGAGVANYRAVNSFPVVWRGPAEFAVVHQIFVEGRI